MSQGRHDGGQQIVAVDHLVVVGRRGIVGVAVAQVVDDREFADTLFVRHDAVRRQAAQHGRQAGLDGRRLEYRHQHAHGDQRIAAEVGVVLPRTCQQFVRIAEEFDHVLALRIGVDCFGEKIRVRDRRERRLPVPREHAQMQRIAAARGLQRERARLIRRDRAAVRYLHRKRVARGAVGAVALPPDRIPVDERLRLNLGRGGIAAVVVAQKAHRGQQGLPQRQLTDVDRDIGRDAVQIAALDVAIHTRRERRIEAPTHRLRGILEPEAGSAITGRKDDEQSGLRRRAHQ